MPFSKQAKLADKSNWNHPFSTLHHSVPVTSYLRRGTIVTEKERLRLASEKKNSVQRDRRKNAPELFVELKYPYPVNIV